MKLPDQIPRAAVEAVPSAMAIAAGPVFGVTFSDLAALLGCIFLLMQMAYMVWRWRRDQRREKANLAAVEE